MVQHRKIHWIFCSNLYVKWIWKRMDICITESLCYAPETTIFTLLLLLLSCFSRVWLCAPAEMAAHQAPPSLGFSRQEHWSGLPFPSPMHESEKWKGSLSVLSDSSRPHGLQLTRLLRPWDFPDKSTGVGCHWKLQELVINREAWHAEIHGMTKSRTWLSDWTELNWCM